MHAWTSTFMQASCFKIRALCCSWQHTRPSLEALEYDRRFCMLDRGIMWRHDYACMHIRHLWKYAALDTSLLSKCSAICGCFPICHVTFLMGWAVLTSATRALATMVFCRFAACNLRLLTKFRKHFKAMPLRIPCGTISATFSCSIC
jgi:hypothetical protein